MSRRAWTAFAIVSVLWGIPYLLIKVAVDDGVAPLFLAWGRCLIGAAVLLPFAIRSGALAGLARQWRWLLAFTLIEIVVPWPLLGTGEQRLSSSLAAILIASVPLIVSVIAFRFDPDERPTGARLAGMVVGFGGVVALLGIDVAGRSSELVGAGLLLLTALCYATGPMIIRHRLADADPIATIAGSLAIATVVLTPFAALTVPEATPSTDAVLSIVALGVLCSAVSFVFFFRLIAEAGPSRGMIITYVNPVVAVILGVALLGEDLGPGAIAGMLLILAGSWLATGGRGAAKRLPADAQGQPPEDDHAHNRKSAGRGDRARGDAPERGGPA
jgi:drug/metabolite transporter (DMT)-like permease